MIEYNHNDPEVTGYELWALGYDEKSFVVPMECQIGNTATSQEELDELVELAKTLTTEQLAEQYKNHIKDYKIKSIQLQVEELHDNGDDCINGEPVYERLVELEVK